MPIGQIIPYHDITWVWFTDLVRATFYPLEAQDNAFTAWNDVEFKDDVPAFFDKVRKNLRRYPIPMTHLISILSFQLGKTYAVRIKSRMAMHKDSEITLYELQAIAEELFLLKEKETKKRFIPYRPTPPPPRPPFPRQQAMPQRTPTTKPKPSTTTSVTPSSAKNRQKVVAALAKINKEAQAQSDQETTPEYICYKCDRPNTHYCFHCPKKFPKGCPVCGKNHHWRDCPIVAQKREAYHAAGIVLEEATESLEEECEATEEDVPDQELSEEIEDLAVASVSIPTMTWQTHVPLAALRLEDFPFRHECLVAPSIKGRLVYRCRVDKAKATCLFDSGANCSLIAKEWVDKHQIPYHPNQQSVTLAQGDKKETILGYILPLDFYLGTFQTKWPFFVLPHLSHNVILGTDFALRHRVTYDPYDWSLVILGDTKSSLPTFLQLPITPTISTTEQKVDALALALADTTLQHDNQELVEEAELSPNLDQFPFLIPFQELCFPKMGNAPQRPVEHEIILRDNAKPKKISPYPLSEEKRQAMHKQIADLLEQGAIEPSYSTWASPILFVKKKDHTWRMCVDFRNLNTDTKSDAYPLPRISTLLQRIGQASLFTKIDLASGFHQVPVKHSSREATAFSTAEPVRGHSHFQWRVMPFGLINAPATFQRLMETVLADIPNCMVYIDDILIYTVSHKTHMEVLLKVLHRLLHHKLYIKFNKCEFLKTTVTFLGHCVEKNSITPDPSKKQKIQGWATPLKSAKEVRQFWGLVSWLGMYLPNLATIAAPLTKLSSSRRKFVWTAEAEQSMKELQRLTGDAVPLLLWEAERPTRITTDASDVGLGAVMEQLYEGKWHPTEFWSRKLKPAETRYSATDKEWLAVVEAVSTHWRHLLEGKPCIIRTDHKPLLSKLSKSAPIPPLLPRQAR